MSIVTLPAPLPWQRYLSGTVAPSLSTVTIDGTTTRFAAIVPITRAGSIRKVGFRIGTVTTSQSLDIRIETLDASGSPSGTLWGTNTSATLGSIASNTNYWNTLTADASVSLGDRIAVVIQWTSTTGSTTLQRSWSAYTASQHSTVYTAAYNFGSWSKSTTASGLNFPWIEYSDGVRYHCGSFPGTSTSSQSLSTSASPDEFGLYFQLPFKSRCCGVSSVRTRPATSTLAYKLYDSDGTTVLASKTGLDGDWSAASPAVSYDLFTSAATLEANTWYRLTYLAESSTSFSVSYIDVDDTLSLGGHPTGPNWYATQRNAGGAWTETNTRLPLLYPLLDGIDVTAAGALMRHPGMAGGFNG